MILAFFRVSLLLASTISAQLVLPQLASVDATDDPLNLHGRFPSAENIIANSSKGLEQIMPGFSNHTRFLSRDRQVLGYVTPWNQPRGRDNSEWYRGKIDMISPAWYTIESVPAEKLKEEGDSEASMPRFDVHGGIPTEEDKGWLERMRAPATTPDGQQLPPVRITPRFQFDRWPESDMIVLRDNQLLWYVLTRQIVAKMSDGPYDGIVLETGANWALPGFIKYLGETFTSNNLTVTVVFEPLRVSNDMSDALKKTTESLMKAMQAIVPLVDYVTVMTYDWAGVTGIELDMDKLGLDEGNPLRKNPEDTVGIRVPAPNQPARFLESNIELLAGASLESLDETGDVTNLNAGAKTPHKYLMGLPMYGYSYPLTFIDAKTAQRLPRVPTSSPPKARSHLLEAQNKAREKGLKMEQGKVPLLRLQGKPMMHADMLAIFEHSRPLIYLDEESDEMRFDYIAASEDKSTTDAEGRREGIFHRAYMPSAYTMTKRREAVQENGVGAALWDLGQADPWVLHAL